MNPSSEKICLECGRSIHGRMDKKFCSDQCRSNHYHRLKQTTSECIRQINSILRKNWQILSEFPTKSKKPVPAEVLRLRGFDFNYFTNCVVTKDGMCHYYCYDKGYIEVDENYYLLISR